MEFKGTQGGWGYHLVSDDTTCNCTYVLSEISPICVATIHYRRDDSLEESEYPELEQAKANAKLIIAAPKLLTVAREYLAYLKFTQRAYAEDTEYNIEGVLAIIKQATE